MLCFLPYSPTTNSTMLCCEPVFRFDTFRPDAASSLVSGGWGLDGGVVAGGSVAVRSLLLDCGRVGNQVEVLRVKTSVASSSPWRAEFG